VLLLLCVEQARIWDLELRTKYQHQVSGLIVRTSHTSHNKPDFTKTSHTVHCTLSPRPRSPTHTRQSARHQTQTPAIHLTSPLTTQFGARSSQLMTWTRARRKERPAASASSYTPGARGLGLGRACYSTAARARLLSLDAPSWACKEGGKHP
jgi:hypothetical protein